MTAFAIPILGEKVGIRRWTAILAGYVLFGDLPDGRAFSGAAIVMASGIYILRREAVVKEEA